MDHSQMDHGMGSTAARCSMNMLFTWNTENLCIIFRWWHVSNTFTLILSLLAVVALTAGYEAIRSGSRQYEALVEEKYTGVTLGDDNTENTTLLWPGRNKVEVNKKAHIIKALLYATQTFYAFMLMLLFMTYNGWVMLAVAVGAFLGYLLFGVNTSASKETACH